LPTANARKRGTRSCVASACGDREKNRNENARRRNDSNLADIPPMRGHSGIGTNGHSAHSDRGRSHGWEYLAEGKRTRRSGWVGSRRARSSKGQEDDAPGGVIPLRSKGAPRDTNMLRYSKCTSPSHSETHTPGTRHQGCRDKSACTCDNTTPSLGTRSEKEANVEDGHGGVQ
jgi:hypothetical protein